MNVSKDPKERDGKFLNEAAQTKQKFEGTIKPHLIFESGSPDELFYQLASSADSGLLMLSDEGLPLKDFNESYSSSQKSEFLRLMRHSSGLDPIKKSMSKSEWKYALPLSSVLWTTDFPTLCTSLKDQSMQETGFGMIFLMDIQGISGWKHTVPKCFWKASLSGKVVSIHVIEQENSQLFLSHLTNNQQKYWLISGRNFFRSYQALVLNKDRMSRSG